MRFLKLYQFLFCFFSLIFINYAKAQFITIDNKTYTDQQLVGKFIGVNNASCVTISGVRVSGGNLGGSDSSYGYFTNGTLLGMDEGIILSTGSALQASGPKKSSVQSVTANNWIGDQDLAYATGLSLSNLSNATVLEFDFKSSLSNKVSFRYMFLSEEYRPDNCQYSDAFAFLLKKADNSEPYRNIALIPGTNIPVTSTTINGANQGSCTPQNIQYFGGFLGYENPNLSPTNFNGQTKVLTAIADVDAGELYHIKLVIADEGRNANSQYDSAVFLEAGSFTGNIDLLPYIETDDSAIICNGFDVTLQPKNPTDINDLFAKYYWYKDGVDLGLPTSQSFYKTNIPGEYRLKVELSSGCTLAGSVRVEDAPIAQIDNTPIPVCDADFDGKFSTILSDHTFQIVKNFSRDFKISYFTSTGTLIDPDKKFEFTQNPEIITVQVGAFSCAPDSYTVQFYHERQLSMNYPQSQPTPPTFNICDDELKGSKEVKLEALVDSEITTETNTVKTFYNTQAEAKKGGPSTVTNINPVLSPTNLDKTYFVRIEDVNSKLCPNYSSFRILFKQPKRSAVLKDTLICKGTKVELETEPDFDSYRWYDKADPLMTTITTSNKTPKLPAGNYVVELGFNGCVHPQDVKIAEPADLVINNALIEGNQVTVLAANGIPPYRYKLDNGLYQSSNVFDNVPKGDHTIEVLDACGFLTRDFSIINVKNVITPNNDGVNDFIDYSDLMTKSEPRFEVYDRNGILVFKGDTNNQFIWDGTSNGRYLPTSSYWYILEWNEAGNTNRTKLSGWILLKNRN